MEIAKAFLDRVLARIISRKLSVWLAALILTLMGKLESGDFVAISLVYIGMQGVEDIITKWRFGWQGQFHDFGPQGLLQPSEQEENIDNAL